MVGRNSDPQGTNATFSISDASLLSYSSAQVRGLSIAIASLGATPDLLSLFLRDGTVS